MRTILTLTIAAILLLPLAPAQAADISPVPSGLQVGYMWDKDTGGPAVVLPWELQTWQIKKVTASVTADLAFGGVSSVDSGAIPAAAGVGLALTDEQKKVHGAALCTTKGKLAGFVGWQAIGLGGASLVDGQVVPNDGLILGYETSPQGNGLSVMAAKTWSL
jgi:hypothetical protein